MAIENAKTLNVRIKNKYDSYENWAASGLILEAGEIALAYTTVNVDIGNGKIETHPELLLKCGNGKDTFANLPWLSAKAADVPAYAKKSEADFKAWVKTFISIEDVDTTAFALAKDLTDEIARAKAAEEKALTDANAHTDSELARLVGDTTVGTQISSAITNLNLANTYDAKGAAAAAETAAKGHADSLNTAMNTRVEALEAIDHDHANKAELDLIVAGDKAKWDAMEQNAKDYADDLDEAMDARVLALEGKFTGENSVDAKIAAAVAAETSARESADNGLQGQITALSGLVGDETVEKQITDVTNPLANRVKAIEDDYLKAADKTELQGQITANANAIELLTNGVSADEVDGVNDLIQYVKDHGTEVTGIKNDIKANADAIDAIEADYLKAADKNELAGQISGLDTRMGAAETAIGTKAAQADLEALAGRVGTVEGDLNTAATGLKARMTTAEGEIDALQGLVGDKKVETQISEAIAALKIGDYAKAADLTAAINQHNTDKAALEGAIALKANDADLAAIAKTGSTDDLVQGNLVLVFDCGTSAV